MTEALLHPELAMTDEQFEAHQAALLTETEALLPGRSNRKCENRSLGAIARQLAKENNAYPILKAWISNRQSLVSSANDFKGRTALRAFKDASVAVAKKIRDITHVYVITMTQAINLDSPATVLFVDEASQITLGNLVAVLMSNRHVRIVCLIGDRKQIPPFRETFHANELEDVLAKSALDIFLVEDVLGKWFAKLSVRHGSISDGLLKALFTQRN